MNNFTIDFATKSESLISNSRLRLNKQNMMLKFMETISNEPEFRQKQISKQLDCSKSTIKRYRDDIQMDSLYSRNKYNTKNNKSNTSISQTRTHTTNEYTKNIKLIRNNGKNDLKVGSILEYDQDTNFITLAKKLTDNN